MRVRVDTAVRGHGSGAGTIVVGVFYLVDCKLLPSRGARLKSCPREFRLCEISTKWGICGRDDSRRYFHFGLKAGGRGKREVMSNRVRSMWLRVYSSEASRSGLKSQPW